MRVLRTGATFIAVRPCAEGHVVRVLVCDVAKGEWVLEPIGVRPPRRPATAPRARADR